MAWNVHESDFHAPPVDPKVEITQMVDNPPEPPSRPLREQLETIFGQIMGCHQYVDTMEERFHSLVPTKHETQPQATGIFAQVNGIQRSTIALYERLVKLSEQL